MVYHVIIALNGVGKRRVGDVISVLEKNGLELVEIRKRISASGMSSFTDIKQLIVLYRLNELEAMVSYRSMFSEDVFKKKFAYFCNNHVELFFENDEKIYNPNELWEDIRKNVFPNDRKLPIMFVVTSTGENGINIPFIHDNFELAGMRFINSRTLIPLER